MMFEMMFSAKPNNKSWFGVIRMVHLGIFRSTNTAREFFYFSAFKIGMCIRASYHFFSGKSRKFMSFSPMSHVFAFTSKAIATIRSFVNIFTRRAMFHVLHCTVLHKHGQHE